MSELLTTEQMMSKLKVNQLAVAIVSGYEEQVTKTPYGEIVWTEETRKRKQWNYPLLNYSFMSAKWRILPQYVSFEEAIKALKEGKRVICDFKGRTYEYYMFAGKVNHQVQDIYEEFNNWYELWDQIFEGKWWIKE